MTNTSKKPRFSKSGLISVYQCSKKLHLERNFPDLGEFSEKAQSAFNVGYQIGDMAQRLYGAPGSVEIEYQKDLDICVRETAGLIAGGADFPIFEATFEHEGVYVRVDILIPDEEEWRAVEVKACTEVKDHHVIDCAIQWWVMRNSDLPLTSIALAHVNNKFVYAGDGTYDDLLVEQDQTAAVTGLDLEVVELIAKAREAAVGDVPIVRVGAHCEEPYDCKFRSHCWPTDAEYPITGIGGFKKDLAAWVNAGHTDIRDLDADEITGKIRQRIHRITSTGEPEILEGAKIALDALEYPRYYLDFESVLPAIPIWEGMRPYYAVPVQYSCHIDDGEGDGSLAGMDHKEFLSMGAGAPMEALAESLIECLGDSGPVLMYSAYEKRMIKLLATLHPDLAIQLNAIVERLVDLKPIVKDHYYHPQMLGSWSIKDAVPAIAPHMNYENLPGINNGMGAAEGYMEAIHQETSEQRKAELEEELLEYCKFDTEAMVEIVNFFVNKSR